MAIYLEMQKDNVAIVAKNPNEHREIKDVNIKQKSINWTDAVNFSNRIKQEIKHDGDHF